MTEATPREEVAWLLWCISEGYIKAEDRAIMTNWFTEDPRTLTEHDWVLRAHLLDMADIVIKEVRKVK